MKNLKNYILAIIICFTIACGCAKTTTEETAHQQEINISEEAKDYHDNYFQNGLAAYTLGNYTESIKQFDLILEQHPGNSEAFYHRGLALWMNGNTQRAINDFDIAIKLNPSLGKAYSMRGSIYLADYRLQSAISDFNRAISISPDFAYSYMNRATAYVMIGHYDLAIQDADRATSLVPKEQMPFHTKAIALYLKGQIIPAMTNEHLALSRGRNWAPVYFVLAGFYDKINRKKAAKQYFLKAYELDNTIRSQMNRILSAPVDLKVREFHRQLIKTFDLYTNEG